MVNVDDARLFLGDNAAHLQTRAQYTIKRVVGIDVEFLLGFALHVLGSVSVFLVGSKNTRKSGTVHVPIDHFGRCPDVGQQPGEVTCGASEFRLTRHNKFL